MALQASVEAQKAAKLAEMAPQQQQAQDWIEKVTGRPFDQPFAEYVRAFGRCSRARASARLCRKPRGPQKQH